MKSRSFVAIVAGSALALTLGIAPAQAGSSHRSPSASVSNVQTLAEGLGGPLKVAFGPHNSVLVAEAMSGQLTSISDQGKKTVLVSAPGKEIGGVSYSQGLTYYFENLAGSDEGPAAPGPALLKSRDRKGLTHTVADLFKFESRHNPDGQTVYGVRNAPEECLAQSPSLQSRGELFSHPYSSYPTRNGIYVGDAGANVILHVSSKGKVQLVKALPAEPLVIDQAFVDVVTPQGIKVPACMMGRTYWAQPVPTDITVKGNWMYYTVLPGVPGEMMSKGKVYKMNLHSKRTQAVASGLNTPTGIALDSKGSIYVSELFGDGVAKIVKGEAVTVIPTALASDVAIDGRKMIVSANALAPSGVVLTARLSYRR